MKDEYYELTGIELNDSFADIKRIYHYQRLRQFYSYEQLQKMQQLNIDVVPKLGSNWQYKISDMNEAVIVAHIKEINEKNGFPSYERQFKKQAKEILAQYSKGQIRWALHYAENIKLENEISFTFIKSLIDKGNSLSS